MACNTDSPSHCPVAGLACLSGSGWWLHLFQSAQLTDTRPVGTQDQLEIDLVFQDPRVAYRQTDNLQQLFSAVQSCKGLASGILQACVPYCCAAMPLHAMLLGRCIVANACAPPPLRLKRHSCCRPYPSGGASPDSCAISWQSAVVTWRTQPVGNH